MEKWAEKLINQHKKPIVKCPLVRTKIFIPKDRSAENERVLQEIDKFAEVLSASKVDRRCGRSTIYWLAEEDLGAAKKIVGPLFQMYGFQNFSGHFLVAEEVLYLLEKNRIELFWNNVPLSIEQGYSVILARLELRRFRAYKKLAQQGIKLVPTNLFNKRNDASCTKEPPQKKIRVHQEVFVKSSGKSSAKIKELFESLQRNGPKMSVGNVKFDYDYKVFLQPKDEADAAWNCKILDEESFDSKLALRESDSRFLACFPTDGFPCFKIVNVQLPSLV